ncbi:MAG TPA: hypothetical protein VGI74_12850 [Streptosporangiaceae bacterium]
MAGGRNAGQGRISEFQAVRGLPASAAACRRYGPVARRPQAGTGPAAARHAVAAGAARRVMRGCWNGRAARTH